MSPRTRTRGRRPARRRRCQGACGQLYDPSLLVPLDGRVVCQQCLLLAAAEEAGEAASGSFDHQTLGGPGDAVDPPGEYVLTAQERTAATKPIGWERFRKLPNEQVEGWPLRNGRISASALAQFTRCPEQFRLQHVQGMRQRGSGQLVAGSGVHGALERAASYRIERGERMPSSLLVESYQLAFDQESDDETDWTGKGRGKDGWRKAGEQVTVAYHDRVRDVAPVEAEAVFSTRVPGCPVPLVGYIDLVTVGSLVDYKVGARAHDQIASDWRVQGLVYLLAPYALPMSWHSMTWPSKDGEVRVTLPEHAPGLVMPRSAANYASAVQLVGTLVRAILAYTRAFGVDEPWPAALTHTWACDLCDFRSDGRCQWWNPTRGDLL